MTTATDPEETVARAFHSRNARDIDAFMSLWRDDGRIYAFPDILLLEGAEAIRQRCLERFEEPNYHATLINRATYGDVVVAQELVARTLPEGRARLPVLTLYEASAGRIARLWVKSGAPTLLAAVDVVLRPALEGDADLITQLTRAAYMKWVARLGREPRPMAVDYADALKTSRIEIGVVDGAPVALVELVDEDACLLIKNVAVAPHMQGRGVGKALMLHVERTAMAAGRSRLRLYTNKFFAENIRLYENLGYSFDFEEDLNGSTAVHMSKRL